jgi:hypothetical protein
VRSYIELLELQVQQQAVQNNQLQSSIVSLNARIDEVAENNFLLEGGKKGVITPASMNSFLGAPGQQSSDDMQDIGEAMESLQNKWWVACHAVYVQTGTWPKRDMNNVVFRVKFLKLEQIDPTDHTLFCKHGDYRVHGTLVEAKGCDSLEEVCKRVCHGNKHIDDYRELGAALNADSWAKMQHNVKWCLADTDDGRWGTEREWVITFEEQFKESYEPVINVFVGIVSGYDKIGRFLPQGCIQGEEL